MNCDSNKAESLSFIVKFKKVLKTYLELQRLECYIRLVPLLQVEISLF